MLLTGHKTRAIFDRYNIINEQELLDAGDQLVEYLAQHAQAPRAAPPPRATHHRVSARRAGPRARRGWTHRQAHRRPTARDPAAATHPRTCPGKPPTPPRVAAGARSAAVLRRADSRAARSGSVA